MKNVSQILAEIKEQKDFQEYLKTGFSKLDSFLDGGFMRKELIVLGAPTGKGKSFIAGQILLNVASQGFKTAYFSLEISNQMVISRLVGAKADIKPNRLVAGLLTSDENAKRLQAESEVEQFNSLMSFSDDIYKYEKIEAEIKSGEYDFIVIDFIQNIMYPAADEYTRLSAIATNLQKLAKDTNSCIIVLSQLSNSVSREKRDDVIEYKGSGNIATVCDLGLFIERADTGERENLFSIKIRKNRRGISGFSFDFIFSQPGGQIKEI